MFTITENEWDTAEYYLGNKSNGTKLTYSASINSSGDVAPRKSQYKTKFRWFYAIEKEAQTNPKVGQTFHSFIKIEGIIYGIAQGKSEDAVIGSGHYGKVKYIQDREGNLYVLKLEYGENFDQYRESIILKDRRLSRGKHKIRHFPNAQDASSCSYYESKYATHMVYLGTAMEEAILDACPNEKRINMAIQLCLAVYDLHSGRSGSLTKTAHAHRDIKPSNVTWDEQQAKAHLIDFGLSHLYPQKITAPDKGSAAYVPQLSGVYLTGEQYDLFALKRTLYMPDKGYCSLGYYDKDMEEYSDLCPGILTLNILKQLDLERFINTSSTNDERKYFASDTMSAGALAAILIAAQLQLALSLDDLKNDKSKVLVIIALYGKSKGYIEEVLKDKRQSLIIGAFYEMGKFSEMDVFMQDKAFVSQMERALNREQACVLIHLKCLDLSVFNHVIYESHIVSALYTILQQPISHTNKKCTQSIIEQPDLVKTINLFEEAKLQEFFLPLFSSPRLCHACANINAQDVHTIRKLKDLLTKKVDCEEIINKLALFEQEKRNRQIPSISLFTNLGQQQVLVANTTSVRMLK